VGLHLLKTAMETSRSTTQDSDYVKSRLVYKSPAEVWFGAQSVRPTFEKLVRTEDGWIWAMGSALLLRSLDGFTWENLLPQIGVLRPSRIEHVFRIEDGYLALVRSGKNVSILRCASDSGAWSELLHLPPHTTYVASVARNRLIIAYQNHDNVSFATLGLPTLKWQKSDFSPIGVPQFLSFKGTSGFLGLWENFPIVDSTQVQTTAIFFSRDGGASWDFLERIEGLCICSAQSGEFIILGFEGKLIEINRHGIRKVAAEGDIVAVDAEHGRIAISENEASPPDHQLLRFRGTEWTTAPFQAASGIAAVCSISASRILIASTSRLELLEVNRS